MFGGLRRRFGYFSRLLRFLPVLPRMMRELKCSRIMNPVSSEIPAATTRRGFLRANPARSITRSAVPTDRSTFERIFEWALRLPEEEVERRLEHLRGHFAGRGGTMDAAWQRAFAQAALQAKDRSRLSASRQLYIGSLFSQEFATESGGLLNPGLCLHADQSRLPEGSARFLLVMDGLGKNRTSSIIFREGVIDADYHVHLHGNGCRPCAPELVANPMLRRSVIFRHLHDLGFDNLWTRTLMESLEDEFTRSGLTDAMNTALGATRRHSRDSKGSVECLNWLSRANYEMTFDPRSDLSDRVLLPQAAPDHGGLHEGRFTLVNGDDPEGGAYFAVCMSCNGYRDLPLLLESRDLVHFTVSLLGGGASRGRGMALFPRKFGGRHAALCERGDDAIYLMYSENPVVWEIATLLREPVEAWEALGIRPCGAPMETVSGWLVLYHGRGEMGREAIGAMLLDGADPSKRLGYLKQPLLEQPAIGTNGTSPVSLQSSGALIHRERLLIAYTVDEKEVEIAQFDLEAILNLLRDE